MKDNTMKNFLLIACLGVFLGIVGCAEAQTSAATKDSQNTNRQQEQYGNLQPVPFFDYSLERDMQIQLYGLRNITAITHSVWRSDLGTVEGDCPSIGFGMPYDISLTNPLVPVWRGSSSGRAGVAIEQPEPNGVYASKNTTATWVMCAGTGGAIVPIYVETKVTSYPYPVSVNYATNRVIKTGEATVTLKLKKR